MRRRNFNMSKKNNLFKNSGDNKGRLKYFILSFAVFIVILSALSVLLFMNYIDFDFGNIVPKTEEASESGTEPEPVTHSVSELTGKTKLLFVCENEGEMEYAFTVTTDYDNKFMRVTGYDKSSNNAAGAYRSEKIDGLKQAVLSAEGEAVDKYVLFNSDSLTDFLSLFTDISVEVPDNVSWNGQDFKLELNKGRQYLSADYTAKLLLISDNSTRESIICDIINAVLTEENVSESYDLFTNFVNLSKTDISVIDYSNGLGNIEIYVNSDDKFFPETSAEG